MNSNNKYSKIVCVGLAVVLMACAACGDDADPQPSGDSDDSTTTRNFESGGDSESGNSEGSGNVENNGDSGSDDDLEVVEAQTYEEVCYDVCVTIGVGCTAPAETSEPFCDGMCHGSSPVDEQLVCLDRLANGGEPNSTSCGAFFTALSNGTGLCSL